MKKMLTITAVIFLVIGITAGCSKKEEKPAETKKPPPKVVQAQPEPDAAPTETTESQNPDSPDSMEVAEAEEPEEKVYKYNPIQPNGKVKRNPFVPIKIDPVKPIEHFEVSQLGVNGVLIHGVKKASVMTPACQSVVVKIGNRIGIHEGRVVDITLAGVLVKETYLDVRGRIQEYERLIPNQPYKCGR